MNLHFFQTFVWTTLLETVNLKPLIVALMLMLGQQLSGVNAVIFFSVTIFNAAKTSLPSLLENVIVGGNSALRTVSFDWFLSSLESILNLEFCLLKLFIFYQKLLWNIRSRLHSSTFSRCLSVLDFWNVNLGVYYKLEKKSFSNQTWFFFRVRTWF